MKRAILVGASSPLKTSFLKKVNGFLVACDKGYEVFLEEGIEPDLLVGDFDTLDRKRIQKPRKTIVLNPIKDDTDVFFAVKWLLQESYDDFLFFGCLGGKRIEHSIANIEILSYLKEQKARARMYTNDLSQVLFVLKDEEMTFENESGFLSVFSQEKGTIVSESGLKYEISDYNLDPFVPLGVSNEFLKGKKATLRVHGGKILIVKECHEYQ